MKEWLIKRDSLSAYNTIFKELHLSDQEHFRRYLRMNTDISVSLYNTVSLFQEFGWLVC